MGGEGWGQVERFLDVFIRISGKFLFERWIPCLLFEFCWLGNEGELLRKMISQRVGSPNLGCWYFFNVFLWFFLVYRGIS